MKNCTLPYLRKTVQVLLFLGLICFPGKPEAQTTQKNNISLTVAPNWFLQQTPEGFEKYRRHHAKTGYQFSLAYGRAFTPNWTLLAGGQYDVWSWSFDEREHFITHGPNPIFVSGNWINHSQEDRAWQIYGGIRYSGQAHGAWRWQAEFLSGLSFVTTQKARNIPYRTMLQLGTGAEWRPGIIGLFLSPSVRYVLKEFKNDYITNFSFLIPSLNAGVRWWF